MRAARLGDDIDDFCVKCKRVMNHAVVSILGDEPAKVRCRTRQRTPVQASSSCTSGKRNANSPTRVTSRGSGSGRPRTMLDNLSARSDKGALSTALAGSASA